jgi:NTP pyrophosphatase (non-canonical NTP hydrolase)
MQSIDDFQFKDMSLTDIAIQCIADSKRWFPEHAEDVGYLALCMAGEVGEFANLVKKGIRGTHSLNDDEFRRAMAFELTDVFIYLMNLAAVMDIDLGRIYQIKREYNEQRFGSGDIQQ